MPKGRKRKVVYETSLNPDTATYPVQVDDPYERGAKLVATRRMSDFISREHAAGRIDTAQKAAADEFYRLRVITAGVMGQEPTWTKPVVDNSRKDFSITEAKQRAHYKLNKARQVIGVWAYGSIDQCVMGGLTPTQIEQRTGQSRVISAAYIKDGLEMLAIWWGFADDPNAKRRRAAIVSLVGEASEPVVDLVE